MELDIGVNNCRLKHESGGAMVTELIPRFWVQGSAEVLKVVSSISTVGEITFVFKSIARGPSKTTLYWLHLTANALTLISQQIKLFPRLVHIYLSHQKRSGFGIVTAASTSYLGGWDMFVFSV